MASALSPPGRLTLKILAKGPIPLPSLAPSVLLELTVGGFGEISQFPIQLHGREVSLLRITEHGRRYVESVFTPAGRLRQDAAPSEKTSSSPEED